MKAKELMTPHPEVVTPSDRLERAAEIMRDLEVGFVPVVEDRGTMKLRGLITDRDITVRHVAAGHSRECQVKEHMTGEQVQTIGPDAELEQVVAVMQRAQVRRIPVVETDGRILGVIAQADVAVKETSGQPRTVAETVEKISEPAKPQG